ncbi:MAG: ABC transporter substrate-binding protein [Alphaproteobacteria bacterium]|nr:ABC transporter substrate-binding protein [Alphaproteobacteria bacterium]
MKPYHFFLVLFLLTLLPAAFAHAENGVFEDKIVFGQTAALNGPASALGEGMNAGILAAFKEINDNGGINGRKLELDALDDGYEPEVAIQNTKQLINDKKVFALIGGVGTPTANAIEPITTESKVPFIGPFTGAEFLRSPFKRYVVNIRGSYWQETEEWIKRLTEDLNIKRIAILYQDDSYGRAGLSGVEKALEKRNMKLVGSGNYLRNTTAIKTAVLEIRKSDPEAVVMVGAYKPCAAFIKTYKKLGYKGLFVNISFVGSDALSQELKEEGEGVIISQVVPFPYDAKASELVKNYQHALKSYKPESSYGFVTLEGYMVGRLVGKILQNMDGDISREAFLDKIYELKDVDLDDIQLHFGPEDNQGMDKVFMTILQKDGTFLPVNRLRQSEATP